MARFDERPDVMTELWFYLAALGLFFAGSLVVDWVGSSSDSKWLIAVLGFGMGVSIALFFASRGPGEAVEDRPVAWPIVWIRWAFFLVVLAKVASDVLRAVSDGFSFEEAKMVGFFAGVTAFAVTQYLRSRQRAERQITQ